jgi:hypothetical protein
MKPTSVFLLVTLASACCALAQTPQAASGHGWRESQHRDAADSYTFTRFTLVGKFLTPLPGQVSDRPALTLDCIPPSQSNRAKLLAADLLVGTTLKIQYVEPEEIRGTNYFPKVTVGYSTDDSKPEERRWEAGTDRIPTAKPSDKSSATIPTDALKKMLRAHTVAITVQTDQGAPVKMQFDMPDSKPLEATCNVM